MHQHRRRKKRPNYGSIEVSRGEHGFGFTISGQQPCILSCIVPNSPAFQAGLRSGDFLISVNGLNVSKLPHESVVQLIGSSVGTIRLAIGDRENYYSDSSDDDGQANQIHQRVRPKFPHHKLKINRNTHNRLSLDGKKINSQANEPKPSTSFAVDHNLNQSTEIIDKISNVPVSSKVDMHFNMEACRTQRSLEYRTVVGYLGTIEMPKQIATSSKLQTVRSCIRKIRQEKRNPTIVLMTILPHCLTLKNNLNVMLAKYPNARISFVSGNSDNDKRFFGLVTSAMYSDGVMCENGQSVDSNVVISNSCHVFVVDTKLTEHSVHLQKADEFRITCTKDPISDLCLEFPNNSEYVVNLIRSMYTLKSVHVNDNERPPVARQLNMDESPRRSYGGDEAVGLVANSPQPSNHSEITTTSSNSDSGIGFHNDCANISDRILVVDFPGLQNRQIANIRGNLRQPSSLNARPVAIINDHSLMNTENSHMQGATPVFDHSPIVSLRTKSKSMDLINNSSSSKSTNCLQARAMFSSDVPGCSKYMNSPSQIHRKYDYNESVNVSPCRSLHESNHPFRERPVDVPHSLQFINPHNLRNSQLAARSCDDVTMTYRVGAKKQKNTDVQSSIDDVSLLGAAPRPPSKFNDDYIFLPPKPVRKSKKPSSYKHMKSLSSNKCQSKSVAAASPKSLSSCRTVSASVENLLPNRQCVREKSEYESIWGSMQDIRRATMDSKLVSTYLEGTYSEPDLTSRALPSNSSPFKRWGQSSFRSRSNETRTPVQRRPSSLAASEGDVYSKSIDDDVDSLRGRSDLTNATGITNGVSAWGAAFEKLLEDPAGLHTFAEFLKKEFSAENIYFWTSCERYRQLDDVERSREAIQIFSKHLGMGAPEPVNVDSQARTTAQEHLQKADRDLFMQAQKQIFNLMKFDSYQRFIRSDLYKSCLDAEAKKLPLPYPGDQLDACLRTHLTSPLATKLKKSLSNAEDRRRKSLLPWHRKVRCKSKDRGDELRKEVQAIGASGTLKVTHSGSDLHSSRSSLSSFDAAISCRTQNQNECDEAKSSLCRVILSDGATTIVQTKPSETIRELVERLLEKRGIAYQAYEGFLAGNSKPMDLEGPSVSLAGKEMLIEQRVVFKLDLPNRKVISVKSKPCKALGEVLRPILHKYSYRLDLVQVSSKEYPEPIDMTLPVTVCDGQRLQIACRTGDYLVEIQPITTSQSPKVLKKVNSSSSSSSIHYTNSASMHPPAFHDHHSHKSFKPNSQQSHLDEITNKVFNELLQEKVDAHSQRNPSNLRPVSDHGSTRSDDFGSETSSGIFGRLKRRDSNFPVSRLNKGKKIVAPSSTTGSDDGATDGVKKPLIAKWKAGAKLQVTGRADNHDFLEGLKRAQRFRLEDQRGTEINCELPDFLKDKENFVNNKLRKTKPTTEPVPVPRTTFETTAGPLVRPQPAPRYSITKSPSATSMQNGNNSPTISSTAKGLSPTMENMASNDANSSSYLNSSFTSQISQSGSMIDEYGYDGNTDSVHPRGPPPLPPKPKILPIKPSNWGQSPSKSDRSPQDEMVKPRNIFMDQANSSFV